MAQEILNCSNIISVVDRVGREMSGGTYDRWLLDSQLSRAVFRFREAPLQEPALRLVGYERESAPVGLGGFFEAAELLEEVRPGGGEEMVRGEDAALLQTVQEPQALFRSLRLRDRDGAVQLDDGRRIESQEDAVERRNLAPVGLFGARSEEHTSELQSHHDLVCRLLL